MVVSICSTDQAAICSQFFSIGTQPSRINPEGFAVMSQFNPPRWAEPQHA